jgi:outer membrane protein OmpA-like peptidoglycan-associated protein
MYKSKLHIVLFSLLFLGISNLSFAQLSNFQVAFEQKKIDQAILAYEKAWAEDSNEAKPFFIKYISLFAIKGDYATAYNKLQPYIINDQLPAYLKDKAATLYQICSFAIRYPKSKETSILNLGDNINSNEAEYFPSINFQDSILLFMRRSNWQREDFYISYLNANGFTNAQKLSDALNSTSKKGSASVSKDANTLFFAAEYPGMGYGRYDIYAASKTDTGWSIPKNLGRNINTDFWESAPSISPDGKALYFCSNRPDGYGGIDIYVSYKNEKGYWEEAENLGPAINTSADEQSPFIHADNSSLYFSSNGWPGFGGADLFVSRKDNKGEWRKPINLGYPINTYDNEGSISVASNGQDAFIASDRSDTRGGLDIYKVLLAEKTRGFVKEDSAVFVVQVNQTQNFNTILFEINSDKIKQAGDELESIIKYLMANKSASIVIEGHTDNTGNPSQNLLLSNKRADAIKALLMQNQIEANRIRTFGFGDQQPIASNNTEAGRALNRRTSFRIVF